jgi:hypothetical protein
MGDEAGRLEAASINKPAGEKAEAAGIAARLPLLLGLEFLIVFVMRIPYDSGFTAFAFGDRGSWLTVSALVRRGMRPAVDFGYDYGLLPVWLSAGWFGALGDSPRAYHAASLLCGIAMVAAIARMAHSLRLPQAVVPLAIAALPFAVMTSYPSMAHAVEAALLCNALAEQAADRRANALALAAAACFAKPSMGYLYGFVLLVFGISDLYNRGGIARGRVDWIALRRLLMPAAATTAAMMAILGFAYGPQSLFLTLLPLAGMKNYAAFHFGFFRGSGKYFWYGAPILFYFVSVTGFWIAASIWLAGAGLIALRRLMRGCEKSSRRRDEFVVATAVLHTLFVTMFFAGPSSWSYYSYILVMGAMAACTAERARRLAVAALAVVAAMGQIGSRAADLTLWHKRAPSAVTAGLWATARGRNALAEAIAALRGHRAELISGQGGAPLLLPQFKRHDYAYLLPGVVSDAKMARVVARFAAAPLVVAVVAPGYGDALDFWPQIKQVFAHREVVMKNDFYVVYRNPDVSPAPPGSRAK